MPKIDLDAIEQVNRTGYPPPFNQEVAGRWYRRLAPATGLTDFGVSHVVLKPGAWSSQRHWHNGEDEFLVMVEGEAILVEDDGRTMVAGKSSSCINRRSHAILLREYCQNGLRSGVDSTTGTRAGGVW